MKDHGVALVCYVSVASISKLRKNAKKKKLDWMKIGCKFTKANENISCILTGSMFVCHSSHVKHN